MDEHKEYVELKRKRILKRGCDSDVMHGGNTQEACRKHSSMYRLTFYFYFFAFVAYVAYSFPHLSVIFLPFIIWNGPK